MNDENPRWYVNIRRLHTKRWVAFCRRDSGDTGTRKLFLATRKWQEYQNAEKPRAWIYVNRFQ